MQWTVNYDVKLDNNQSVMKKEVFPSRSKAGKAVQIFCNSNKGCKVTRDNNTCTYTITR